MRTKQSGMGQATVISCGISAKICRKGKEVNEIREQKWHSVSGWRVEGGVEG